MLVGIPSIRDKWKLRINHTCSKPPSHLKSYNMHFQFVMTKNSCLHFRSRPLISFLMLLLILAHHRTNDIYTYISYISILRLHIQQSALSMCFLLWPIYMVQYLHSKPLELNDILSLFLSFLPLCVLSSVFFSLGFFTSLFIFSQTIDLELNYIVTIIIFIIVTMQQICQHHCK